jgi:long-chain fatty acid transport protein
MSHRSRFTLTALTLVAAASLAPQAKAAGFQLREQSASSQGNAFAGISAGGQDISSLFFNPAVMTQFEGTQFTLGGTFVSLEATYSNGSASRTPVLTGLGFNSAPVTGAALSPISGPASHSNAAISAVLPAFNITTALNPDLRVGLSVNVPFGLTTEYDTNWIGRYHALKSALMVIDVAPSIAYKLTKEVTIGAAFVLRKADAELSNGVDFGTALALKVGPALAAAGVSPVAPGAGQNSPVAVLAMGAPNATLGTPGYAIPGAWDGTAGLKGGGWGTGYKFGMVWEPSQEFRLGVAYSAAMTMTLKGTASFQYPTAMPATDYAALTAAGLTNGAGQADLALPSTTSMGFTWKATPTFTLQGEVARTNWSTFSELRVKFASGAPDSVTNESWQNSNFMSLGGTWKLSDKWSVRAGVAFDQSAVDDAHRTPRIPDNDRRWISAGASYTVSKHTTIDLGYSLLMVPDGKVQLTAANDNITRGNLSGTMAASINIYGVSVRHSF